MAFYSDFAGHYDRIFPVREGTLRFLQQRLQDCRRVLDLGCGTGGYCAGLANEKRTLLGIDLDADMIAQASAQHSTPKFQVMDLADIAGLPEASFDGIYCIGNVLPHLPTGSLPAFLQGVKALLLPGGIWILQTVNFDPLLALPSFEFPRLTFEDAQLEFQRKYVRGAGQTLRFQTRLLQNDVEVFSGETQLHPRTAQQYIEQHEANGFRLNAHYSDFAGNAFESQRPSGSVFVFEREP